MMRFSLPFCVTLPRDQDTNWSQVLRAESFGPVWDGASRVPSHLLVLTTLLALLTLHRRGHRLRACRDTASTACGPTVMSLRHLDTGECFL